MRRYAVLRSIRSVSVVLLMVHLFCPAAQADFDKPRRGALKGGCAKVNITPPVGVWLSGYGSRDKPSDGVVDKLYAKAMVLNDGNNIVAIVATDLLWVPLEITTKVRKLIKKRTGIPQSNILICATHTHFGPKIFTKTKIGPADPNNKVDKSYAQTLIKKLADSAVVAHKNMREVRIGATKGQIPEIAYNRRPRRDDGSVKTTFSFPPEVIATRKIERAPGGLVKTIFTPPPGQPELIFGPIDPDVWVLRIEDGNGQMVGSVVNFACHAVSGSAYPDWFYSISADYPGKTTEIVEQMEGGICLFTSGTAGDIVPIKRGKNARFQMGRALAGEVLRRLQFVRMTGNISLKAVTREIKFPLRKKLAPDRIIDADKSTENLSTEIQVLRIGDIYFLGLPGEVLVEIGLEIKKKAGLKKLIIVSLSNDAIGYVCHSQAYDEGGYEPGQGTNLAQGAGEIMVKEALSLISRFKEGE